MKKTLILIPITLLLISSIIGCKKEDNELVKTTSTSTTPSKTVADLINEGKTVQYILDNGNTPKEIYDNDSTYLDSLYGKNYQAGLIFYFRTDGTGMIAAPTDDRTNFEWGCTGNVTGATGSAVGTGKQNTVDILATCGLPSIAAKHCDDLTLGGYTDWFLPSIQELNQINYKLENKGLGAFGSLYWSSTEDSNNNAKSYKFSSGATPTNSKYSLLYVRAVREF